MQVIPKERQVKADSTQTGFIAPYFAGRQGRWRQAVNRFSSAKLRWLVPTAWLGMARQQTTDLSKVWPIALQFKVTVFIIPVDFDKFEEKNENNKNTFLNDWFQSKNYPSL